MFSFDGTDAVFVGSFLLRDASAGTSFAIAHTPRPPQAVPLPPNWGRLGWESLPRARFLLVHSFYVALLLVRRSLALTPLIHRKRSPFPPIGEGLGGESLLH